MKNKNEWETKSLEWIHNVRKEIDKKIQSKGLTPSQWIKQRGKIDISRLCKSLGLNKIKIISISKKIRKISNSIK